ncbi:hypothetical protein Cantr_04150 [Candida viswanathii]|uniref:DOCKER domain-containing protein n=1 Tax=Candida viswanathii TaxID=5486 RepID=A0A367XME1_9ASCO|nr:hypothetical protein Cantr_04150 [Candida viswanathii]
MTWAPTTSYLKGVVIKPFVPRKKLDLQHNTSLRNIYPGDQVYVFETKDDRWARGYVIAPTIQSDMEVLSIGLNNIDESPVIFPLKYVRIVETIDIIKSGNDAAVDKRIDRSHRPKFPSIDNRQLSTRGQIRYAINELNGLIFISFACGELKVYRKLIELFSKLFDYFMRETHDLFSELECPELKETVTTLLNTIPKICANKELRVRKGGDVLWLAIASKYQYTLARDRATGELLNLSNSMPSVIACAEEELALTDRKLLDTLKTGETASKATDFKGYKNNHILVDLKKIVGDASTVSSGLHCIFLLIYLRSETRRLTETFVLKVRTMEELQKVQNISSALFRNLPADYLTGNVYMVVVVSEEVSLLRRKTFSNLKYVKKGISAGIADISQVFSKSNQSNSCYDVAIHLFGAPFGVKKPSKNPFNWGLLVDQLISGDVTGIAVNSTVRKIDATIKLINHEPFGLTTKTKYSKHHSKLAISMIKPMFYDPFTDNNERLYISLGQIHLRKKKDSRDLYSFEISAPNNESIKFSQGTTQREKRIWQFVAVTGNESVGETVRIDNISLRNKDKKLPIDDFLQLTVYVNGILAGQGNLHYKSGSKLVEYSKKPHAVEIISTSKGNPIAEIDVSSVYVGKLYNSEVTIDNILEYESLYRSGTAGVDGLSDSLVSFKKLKKKHLIKHFPELLTSLFGIVIISGSPNDSEILLELQDNTFKAIVFLLNNVFGIPHQYGHFLKCFQDVFVNQPRIAVFIWTKLSEIYSRGETIWDSYAKSVSNVQDILIRFATKSIQGSWEFEEYNDAVLHSYKAMAHFLSIKSSLLVEDQVKLLNIVDFILTHSLYFDKRVVLNWYETFIDAVRLRTFGDLEKLMEKQEEDIQVAKLLLILRILGTDLVRDRDTRATVLLKSVEWASEVFQNVIHIDSCRLACSVLNMCCIIIFELLIEGESDIVEVCLFLFKLLPGLSKSFLKYSHDYKPARRKTFTQLFPTTYPFEEFPIDNFHNGDCFSEASIEIAIVLGFIARIDKEVAVESNSHTVHLAEFFSRDDMYTIIVAINEILRCEYFESSRWLSLEATLAENCLCVLELLSPVIFQKYITDTTLDVHLCGEFISALLKLGVLDTVALERLPILAKAACTAITSGIGERVELLIDKIWGHLGYDADKKEIEASLSTLVLDYDLIHNVVLYTLKCTRSRKVGSKLLISIMIHYNQIEVERQCIISLFDIYCNGLYEPSECDEMGFINNLKERSINQPQNNKSVLFEFIAYLSRFIKILNRLIRIPDTLEFSEDKVVYKIQALLYLVNVGEPEPLRDFITDLYRRTIKKEDFVQAGLYLEILASTFPWDHHEYAPVSTMPVLPMQTNFERREALLELSAEHYIKAQNLLKAIDVYNYMLTAYKSETYDLLKLSHLHGKLSLRYMELEYQDTIQHTYCRVVFYGNGFPDILRGKERIYEGQAFEHFTSVQQKILAKFPGSVLYNDDGSDTKGLTGKYLDISLVYPNKNEVVGSEKRSFTILKKVPGSSSIFDLWTEETTYETKSPFPTLMSFSDITSYKVIKLSPLDNSIRTIKAKVKELLRLEGAILRSTSESNTKTLFLDLSRELAGTVDSPINGGVGQYRLFIEYIGVTNNNNQASKIHLLKHEFEELAIILKRCLDLHGKIVPHSMRPSHDALVELYQKNFNDTIEAAYSSSREEETDTTSTVSSTNAISVGLRRSHSMGTLPEPKLAKSTTSTSGSTSTSYTSGRSSFLSHSLSLKRKFKWKKSV